VFVIIFGIILLTFYRDRLDDNRPELAMDLADQKASAILISLLRTQAPQQPGTGVMKIADLITTNDYSSTSNERLRKAIEQSIPSNQFFILTIDTDHAVTTDVVVAQVQAKKVITITNAVWLSNTEEMTGKDEAGKVFLDKEVSGTANAILPGKGQDITITLKLLSAPRSDATNAIDKTVQLTVNDKRTFVEDTL